MFDATQAAGCLPFTLVTISNLDWNWDMTPWDSPAAFKNGEPFTGGVDDYLRLLVEEIIPRAEKDLLGPPAWRGIILPRRGYQHSVPTEFWKPFCPRDRADGGGHLVVAEQIN